MAGLHVSEHPLVQHKLALLRDIRTEPRKFRELTREITLLLGYEATRDLRLQPTSLTTPFGEVQGRELADEIGLIPILRAGLGMVDGIWELMPTAQVWHIGLYRDEKTLQPVQYYSNLPVAPMVGICFILDPMLATGGSAVATVDILKKWGAKRIRYVGLIASPEGVMRLREAHPDVDVFVAAVDRQLNDAGYIVPGLGDAGHRLFGTG